MPTYVPIIVCTPGGASDNSYADLADATAYFGLGLRAATWAAYTEAQREQALIDATQDIEGQGGARHYADSPARARFFGTPYNLTVGTTQALHFPTDRDLVSATGSVVTLQVPPDIVAAVCEQALWLLQQQAAPAMIDHSAMKAAGVTSFSADGVAISYGGGKGTATVPEGIAPAAWTKLKPHVRTSFPVSV